METVKFVYYQENELWIGWFEDYPDYRTQGKTLEELKENLKEIYDDIIAGVESLAKHIIKMLGD